MLRAPPPFCDQNNRKLRPQEQSNATRDDMSSREARCSVCGHQESSHQVERGARAGCAVSHCRCWQWTPPRPVPPPDYSPAPERSARVRPRSRVAGRAAAGLTRARSAACCSRRWREASTSLAARWLEDPSARPPSERLPVVDGVFREVLPVLLVEHVVQRRSPCALAAAAEQCRDGTVAGAYASYSKQAGQVADVSRRGWLFGHTLAGYTAV